MNKIYILGIGPGSKDYLLPIADRLVQQSDVLIGGRRALDLFADYNKEDLVITANLKQIKDYIQENYQQKQIAVLVSGDPGLYSMLSYLGNYFAQDKLEVIPGISALQLAFAKTKEPWQDATITSLHGSDDKDKLLELVKQEDKVGFFTDNKFPPNQIAQFLLDNGVESKKGLVAQNLSYSNEEITEGSLDYLSQQSFDKLNVMVIYNG